MYNLQISINNLKNINKNFKIVNCDLNYELYNSKFFFNGLKDYYHIKNLYLSFKTDYKKDLLYFKKDQFKIKNTPFIHGDFLFPLNSFKSRFVLNFKNINNIILLKRFEKFIKKLNKYRSFNIIFNILKINRYIYLYDPFLTFLGNYNSGYCLSSYGFIGFFLYFKKLCSTPISFISKNNYFNLDFKKFKSKLLLLLKNSLNRQYFFYNYTFLYKKKYNYIFFIKNFFKEFLYLKNILRLFFLLIWRFVPPYQGKIERIMRVSKIYTYFYNYFIKNCYKNLFKFNIIFIEFFTNFSNLNLNNIIFIIKNLFSFNINFNLLKLKKRVYVGKLIDFINGIVIKQRSSYNFYIQKKKKKKYKRLFKFDNNNKVVNNKYRINLLLTKNKFYKKHKNKINICFTKKYYKNFSNFNIKLKKNIIFFNKKLKLLNYNYKRNKDKRNLRFFFINRLLKKNEYCSYYKIFYLYNNLKIIKFYLNFKYKFKLKKRYLFLKKKKSFNIFYKINLMFYKIKVKKLKNQFKIKKKINIYKFKC